ncbi:MAG: hydantoinase/oxoprolinase family protein [Desulfovibrionaceae bacterium]|nr:hydantoinase/oxoprolinase family protein [Desulfovibrionaceae bacterium]
MTERMLLGIDAGGTHTDAVLIRNGKEKNEILAKAKVQTRHDDLPSSVNAVLDALSADLSSVSQVTLGTTLAVNAIVQGRLDPVGLLLAAGPGLAPERFALGSYVAVAQGGLDHRGVEVTPLNTKGLAATLADWKERGVHSVACVSKFSPRNPDHEKKLALLAEEAGMTVTQGHKLSGRLNFPRRIATAWYNAAVSKVHNAFLDAVTEVLRLRGIQAQIRLLKADGGSIPLGLARKEPVQTILSGPAASVMGVLALAKSEGTALLLDVGGTTTDIALLADGSPVLDRDGMRIGGRRTLVRALASISIGIGGDSLITVCDGNVQTGPKRLGNAMAFGGDAPTLLDALNFEGPLSGDTGDRARSEKGIEALASKHALSPHTLAQKAITMALDAIYENAHSLLERVNSRPIYTLRGLRSYTKMAPERIFLVGGPAHCLRDRLCERFSLPVEIPEEADVANAIGAALTKPTDTLDVYADSAHRTLRAPRLDVHEKLTGSATLDSVKKRALDLLANHLTENGIEDASVEVVEEDIFAVLDDYGSSSRDIRVSCQVVPGITGKAHADRSL